MFVDDGKSKNRRGSIESLEIIDTKVNVETSHQLDQHAAMIIQ